MKRLVFAALAIAALASCTKSNVQLEQPGEITLQPVAQKTTKAAVDGNSYPTGEAYNFNVWAWWKDCNAGTKLKKFTEPTPTPYIAQGEFMPKSNVSWGGKTPYYWPTKGSLVFAGYSPASAAETQTQTEVTTNFEYVVADSTFTVTNYIQSNNISESKDLMWFDVTDISYDNNGTAGVPVTFKHALSWLTFKFVLNSEITNHTWKITNVELKGVNTKGNFAATKSEVVANAGIWTLPEGDSFKKDMSVYTSSHTVSTTATTLENTANGVVVIPQACVKLFVGYTLTASTGKVISQDVTLDLATGIDDGKWLPGKHYIYTITFGANEILIAPEVADWVDEQVNIPVQK